MRANMIIVAAWLVGLVAARQPDAEMADIADSQDGVDPEIGALWSEVFGFEEEAGEGVAEERHLRGLRRHHHGHHHRRHHRRNLALGSSSVMLSSAELDRLLDDRSGSTASPIADVFPKAHPIVKDTLTSMDGNMLGLKDRQKASKIAAERYKSASTDALYRMNDAVKLQRAMLTDKAKVKSEEDRAEELEGQESGLSQKRDELSAKIRAVMEPRILSLEEHVEQRRSAVDKAKEDVRQWGKVIDQYKAAAVSKLQEQEVSKTDLERAEDELKKAQEGEAHAAQKYETAKLAATHEVEAFKVVFTHLQAKRSDVERQEDTAKNEESSLERTQNIFKAQEQRLDTSYTARKTNLENQVRQIRAEKDKAEHAFESDEAQYRAWKDTEATRVEEAEKRRDELDKAQQGFNYERRRVFNSASSTAGTNAEHSRDWAWDDWAWSASDDSNGDDVEQVPMDN